MTIVGIDDTDSREQGMCTTYAAATLADRLPAVERILLVRCNPAVEHKTRGNAALAVHTGADPDTAREAARDVLDMAVTDDDRTNPGVVVADCGPHSIPAPVADFAVRVVRDHVTIDEARTLASDTGFDTFAEGNGRGLIGALAAVGAWRAHDDWTYEYIAYRERDRWGTDREVALDSVFAAADAGYPAVWDTVDRAEGEAVCVPHTPCPILYGIRGDDARACRDVAAAIDGEPVADSQLFVTNQGTDAHLRDGSVETIEDGRAYRLDATVATAPETREGGHVFFAVSDGDAELPCAAFEPTKRFRDRVRALRVGDDLTLCGEVSDGTLKLEKFAVRDLVETEPATPDCPECGRSMESAGRDQGYRCRDCSTTAPGKVSRSIERALERGWYEVPPCARRHVAKPLVRGGFDAPVHPER